jgi:hypothetical protein
MKFRKMLLLSFISILLVGSLGLHAAVVQAADSLEYRKHDQLVNILKDGDGANRVFSFTSKNKLTAANTKLRLFINSIEADSKDYTVDYDSNTITLNKAPYSGAELHMEYGIIPGFQWGEGVSGTSSIGIALTEGDGSTRTFPVPVNYTLSSTKNVNLYINGTKMTSSQFTYNAKTNTVTLFEKQQAPYSGSKIYFYIPKASITGTLSPEGGSTENPASGGAVEPTPGTATGSPSAASPTPGATPKGSPSVSPTPGATPKSSASVSPTPGATPKSSTAASPSPGSPTATPSPGAASSTPSKPSEPLAQVPTGESYPGSIAIGSGSTFTVNLPASAAIPGYTSYLMVKNASGQVVRQIKIEPGSTSSYSLGNLGLPTGGYYSYLKTVSQSGGLSASVPQFIPVNHEPGHIEVYIGGEKQTYEQPPVNSNGNVLVPLRAIFESLGATVEWDSTTQTVTATRGDRTVVLTIGSKTAYINGVPVALSVEPQLINGYTMVPVRFVSEAFGGEVEWNGESSSVIVFQNKPSVPTSAESEQAPAGAAEPTESGSSSSSPILENISKGITSASDIVFVIDVTGSMGEIIDYIKETVKSFVDSVPAGSNFAVVAYRDVNYPDYYFSDLESYDFTRDKDELKGYLNTLVAYGGEDEDESGLEAIHSAAYMLAEKGSNNAKRIIFVTDAPVHEEYPWSYYTVQETVDMLQTDKIVFDAIAPTSGYVYNQINRLVESNPGGVLYDIEDASILSLHE